MGWEQGPPSSLLAVLGGGACTVEGAGGRPRMVQAWGHPGGCL